MTDRDERMSSEIDCKNILLLLLLGERPKKKKKKDQLKYEHLLTKQLSKRNPVL